MRSFEFPPDDLPFDVKIRVRKIDVLDGDSLGVTLPSGERREVRLAGIDAPELEQPFGEEARCHLLTITGRSGFIFARDVDEYDRIVAEMYCGRQYQSLNLRMISAGYAHNYPHFFELPRGKRAEEVARRDRRGMWASEVPLEPPWDYRARTKDERAFTDLELDRAYNEDIRPRQSTLPYRQEPGQSDTKPKSAEPTSSEIACGVAALLAVVLIFLFLSSVCNN